MNDAGLGEEGGIILLETFLNSKNKNLETLSVSENVLGKKCSKLLSMVVQKYKHSLKKLIISRNNFHHKDIALLLKSLNNCKNLQVVNFDDNYFTMETCRIFSKSLINWPNLREINHNDCKRGIIYILEAISKGYNRNIECLGFQYCSIDEDTFHSLDDLVEEENEAEAEENKEEGYNRKDGGKEKEEEEEKGGKEDEGEKGGREDEGGEGEGMEERKRW
ncbi:ran GTPase activating protein 1 [Rhizophagus clarus]|uniref:Ran GTPase activating protein 1 n=1 Tax=Rhizophagus clarus TaxID=94130 RepID=A0A8H3R237_9GLOM|nr:ran GTPase activating protein 1 [Rhizophagus clarus]